MKNKNQNFFQFKTWENFSNFSKFEAKYLGEGKGVMKIGSGVVFVYFNLVHLIYINLITFFNSILTPPPPHTHKKQKFQVL